MLELATVDYINSLPFETMVRASIPRWEGRTRLFMMALEPERVDPQRWKQVPHGPWMYAWEFDLDSVEIIYDPRDN